MLELDRFFERKKYLEEYNDFPKDFRELIDRCAEHDGGQFLLNFFDQGEQLSANALRDKVYRLAYSLVDAGVKPGDRVAILMGNRIEFPITWLALSVLGAAMLPLNNRLTAVELDYFVNDAVVDTFVTEKQYLPLIEGMSERPAALTSENIILVGDKTKLPEGFSYWQDLINRGDADFRPAWDLDPDALLSIQYTSGSTGLPKGCMLSQRYMIVMGCQMSAFREDPIRSVLVDHSFFYIDPQWQVVAMLYAFGKLHVASAPSSSRFVERVNQWGVEYALVPRPIFGEHGVAGDRNTSLKKLNATAAGASGVENIRRRFGAFVSDDYGMTEVGAVLRVPDCMEDSDFDGTCGVPALFRDVKLLRSDNSECAVGESGELVVKGDGLFLGYFNQPEVTAREYVGEWFRTGDLAVKNEQGLYSIVGRVKDIIRRSSENISALQVEQALTQIPGVKQVAVLAVPDVYRGEEVKAYLLLDEGQCAESVSPAYVISECRKYLPDFKVPRYIEYVESFPYTPSLKVAKPKLKAAKPDLREGCWDNLAEAWFCESA